MRHASLEPRREHVADVEGAQLLGLYEHIIRDPFARFSIIGMSAQINVAESGVVDILENLDELRREILIIKELSLI